MKVSDMVIMYVWGLFIIIIMKFYLYDVLGIWRRYMVS